MADFGDGNPLDAFGLQQDAGALPALQDPEDLLQAAEPQQPAQPGSGPQTDIEDAEIYQALNSGNIPPHWPTTSGPGVTFLVLPPGQEPELAAGEKAERSGNPTVAYRSSNSRRLLLKEYTSLQYVGTRDPTGRTLHRLFIAEVEREAGREERRRDLQPGMLLADGRRGARYICREVHGVPSVWKLRPSRGRQGRPAEGPAQPEQPMQRQRAYQGAHNEPRQPQQVPQQPQQQQQQQMQQTPQVLQPQQQQQQQPPPQPQQQHSPAMEQLLSALFPPSITPSSTPVDLLPLADQLSYVLHQLHPDTSAILDTQLVASDGSCVCLGHLAVAPSRAAAEGGLAEGSATMPELWSLMVLATLREILRPVGAIGFESLLCKTNSGGNTLHWACRFQRPSVIEWLLGHPPSGLPASLPHEWQELLQTPHQPSIALLVQRSLKSGWLPLHSLLREAGEKQQLLSQLQAEERAAAQHTFDRLMQLCQCWILAVEACMGRAYTQQRLEHLTSRPYIHFGCGALLSRVCSELGYEPCQPRSRGQLVMEVEGLQARMAILGH